MATSAEAPQAALAARLSANELGTKDLVFFVVAAAAPLTIVAGVMPLAIRAGGKAAAYGYIVPGIVLLLFSCGFTAMSPLIKNAGALYSYIARGLGRPFGVGSALIALVSYNAMTITLMAGFAYFTRNMFASLFHLNVPWQVLAVVGIIAVGLFGYFRVTLSARVLGIALGLELLVVTIYDLIVVAKGGARGLTAGTFAPSVLHGAGFGALIVLTAGSPPWPRSPQPKSPRFEGNPGPRVACWLRSDKGDHLTKWVRGRGSREPSMSMSTFSL